MYTSRFFRTVLMPAAIFQTVLVGPGYGSGREVIEFITRYGAVGGLLAILAAVVVFTFVLVATYEIARLFRTFDYRSFFIVLLGRYWFFYEIIFAAILVLVLAVSTSAGASIMADTFGLPEWTGAALMMLSIVICNFYGRKLVEVSLTWGMIAFTSVLVVYVAIVLYSSGDKVLAGLMSGDVKPGWAVDGMRWAFYNSFVIPALLYVAREFESRADVVYSGVASALFGVFPAIIFHLTFIPGLPEVLEQQLPTFWMVQGLQMPWLLAAFTTVLIVTIIQTGVGILQGVNERIDAVRIEAGKPGLSRRNHALVSGITVLLSSGLSVFGIITLVAKGYGAMAWGFVVVYLLPLITRGVWVAFIRPKAAEAV